MLPAVAIVGRPNVGKSTLFNCLTRSRDALVADHPGVTRDRRYGFAQFEGRRFLAIDTGGLSGDQEAEMAGLVEKQVDMALEEAAVIVFVLDYLEGLAPEDEEIASRLRRSGKPVILVINKAEGISAAVAIAEFHRMGFDDTVAVSARHGRGIAAFGNAVVEKLGPADEEDETDESRPRFAVIGRPNVGKSTLGNRLLGTNRFVTSPVPGTTRDSISVPCERDGRWFSLVDTAGIRRRARVSDAVEKYSVVQSLQAIDNASVVIVMLDASEGVTDQDVHLIGLAIEQGRAIVIGLNKWDGLGNRERRRLDAEVVRRLDFAPYAAVHHVSALHGSGIAELIDSAFVAYESAGRTLPTPRLNKILEDAVRAHPPPLVRGRRIRLRYAHQGGRLPPLIVIHGGQVDRLPASYRRYLENAYRSALKLVGTPIAIELRSGENPFAGRRNKLTPRQERQRSRVIRHSRKR